MTQDRTGSHLTPPSTHTPLELFCSDSYLLSGSPGQPMCINPVVIDTNVLLNDLRYHVRGGATTALIEAATTGSLRLFAADHVFDEVERRLDDDKYCRRRGLDADAARVVWHTAYIPLIRFVDVPVGLQDGRITLVGARHPTDAPTAALAVLLAPCLSLSEDADLTAHGLAHGDQGAWLTLVLHGRTVARGDQLLISGAMLAEGVGAVVARGVRWLVSAGLGLPAALALGALTLYLLERGTLSRDRLARAIEHTRPVLEELAAGAALYACGQNALRSAAIVPTGSPELVCRIAHLLAVSPRLLSGTKIAEQLRAEGWRVGPADVNRILRSYLAFVEVRRAAWQVGRPRMGLL